MPSVCLSLRNMMCHCELINDKTPYLLPVYYTHIVQDFVTVTSVISTLPQCQWYNPDEHCKTDHTNSLGTHGITSAKQSTTKQCAHFMRPIVWNRCSEMWEMTYAFQMKTNWILFWQDLETPLQLYHCVPLRSLYWTNAASFDLIPVGHGHSCFFFCRTAWIAGSLWHQMAAILQKWTNSLAMGPPCIASTLLGQIST